MSLINEALKRARVEARRQEEEGRRDYNAVPAHSRRPDRQRLLLVAGWGTAAIALGVVVWLSFGSTDRPPVAASEAETSAVPAAPSGPSAIEGAGTMAAGRDGHAAAMRADTTSPTGETPVEPTPVHGSTATEPTTTESTTIEPSPEPVSEPSATPAEGQPASAAATPSPTPSGRAGGSRLEAGRTYLRTVQAADGSTAELGGIAYSTNRPIAVINGSVVSNGDLIAGFTVVSVQPERVELEADGVRFYLALR